MGRDLGADPEVLMLLEHMVLTHHYEPSLAALKALIRSGAAAPDTIDARSMISVPPFPIPRRGTSLKGSGSLDNRRLYRANIQGEE